MAYRRGYYKKDGTYVQGHYTKSRNKSYSNKNKKGCMTIILLMLTLSITTYLINQL